MDATKEPDVGRGPWGVEQDAESGFYHLTLGALRDPQGRSYPIGKTAYRTARKLNAEQAPEPFLEEEPATPAKPAKPAKAPKIKAEPKAEEPEEPKAEEPKASPVLGDLGEFKGTREEWLNAFMNEARPVFKQHGFELPEKVRVSVGFMFRNPKAIGQCWHESASADGTREVFINPIIADSAHVADIVTHELCHTLFGPEEKHGKNFKAAAYGMGLEGKATATVAGDAWREWAFPILAKLGAFPHAAIDPASSGVKKQTTRLLKCECEDCGFIFRATAKHVNAKSLRCPDFECEGVVRVDGGEADEE
jgi:hypothetical protein